METETLYSEAWNGIRRSLEAGRLAHAYVLIGSPRGQALHFAEAMLKLLFCVQPDKPCNECPACRQIHAHQHVDTHWLEPQSKARQIKADEIRALRHQMTQTSFEGGWKAGIILAADCMNVAAANVLLKTLEEPPPQTVLLLITEAPQALLPTILSRCQKLVLAAGLNSAEDAEWREPLMQIMRELPPVNGLEATRLAGRLKMLCDAVKTGIADTVAEEFFQSGEALDESKRKVVLDARTNALLKEVYAEVFQLMMDWIRDILMISSGIADEYLCFRDEAAVLREQAGRYAPAAALQAVQQVEGIMRRLEKNIPDLQVFDEAFRRLVAGPAGAA